MAFERMAAEQTIAFIPGDIRVALHDWSKLTPGEAFEACLDLAITFEELANCGVFDSRSLQKVRDHADDYLNLACQLEE